MARGMRLSRHTDYALRVLMHVAVRGDGSSSIPEIARAYVISEEHLRKVVHSLGKAGFIATQRGRGGGIRLGRPTVEINLGSVVRHTEGALAPVSCVSDRFYERCTCPDEARCPIRAVMKEAREAVVGIMERATVADLCERARQLEEAASTSLDYVI